MPMPTMFTLEMHSEPYHHHCSLCGETIKRGVWHAVITTEQGRIRAHESCLATAWEGRWGETGVQTHREIDAAVAAAAEPGADPVCPGCGCTFPREEGVRWGGDLVCDECSLDEAGRRSGVDT